MTTSRRWLRIVFLALVAASLGAGLSGCLFGVSANPVRLGNTPPGDIIRTHAKPRLQGYYRNFDPAAKKITVTPVESVNKVRQQHTLIATVCDEEGNGRRNRRVEWHVTGVGHIVEVDESGFFAGRGYLVDNKYAVSYTNYNKHTLNRGNEDPSDDIELRPGQTWCTITSAEEGTTYVTVVAPGIYDNDEHKVFAVKHWIDADAILPPSAVNPAGQPHTLTTRITRSSDGAAASGYRVRYRILDGPAATLEPGNAPQVEVVSDENGNAAAILRQLQPAIGVNRILVEVIRPKDNPTAKELVVAQGEITKTWVAPNISIQKTGPSNAVVGQPITYQITVGNTGTIPTNGVAIRDSLPEGLQFISAEPAATRQGPNLIWNFGPLPPQQAVTVQLTVAALAPGKIINEAEAKFAEGQEARACASTDVVVGDLVVAKTGPATAVVGQPVTFQITVTNRGNGPATNVEVSDQFDQGFTHESNSPAVRVALGHLAPGQSQSIPITLVPRVGGRLCNRVTVTADGGLTSSAEHCVQVEQPQLTVLKTGPRFAFVGAPVDFEITVRNAGQIPAIDVSLRDQLPVELQPQQASDGGVVQGNVVSWRLGNLAPGQEATVRLRALAVQIGERVCNSAQVIAQGVNQTSPEHCLAIRGIEAVLTEVIDRGDPVAVGGETTYDIRVTNQGSIPLNGVYAEVILPENFEFVDAAGPPHRREGNRVIFQPFNNMEPRKQLEYQVQVRALKPGKVRVQVNIYARELNGNSPVKKEESTTIYDPNTGAVHSSLQMQQSGTGAALVPVSKAKPALAPVHSTANLPTLVPPKAETPSAGK